MKIKWIRYNRKKVFFGLFLFLLLAGLTFGYAFVTTKLSIEGVAKVKDAKWGIIFTNLQTISGSVTPTADPTISDTNVSFSAKLNDPSDFYAFTVDVVNNGTINAELDSISVTPDLSSVDFVDYTVTYEDGTAIAAGDLLKPGAIKIIKVYLGYVDGLADDAYPTTNQTYTINIGLNYVQCVNKNVSTFANDSWSTIASNVATNPKSYEIGETKEIGMDLDNSGDITSGEYFKVRVVNNSAPSECEGSGFSQTACGFVVEFVTSPYSTMKMYTGTSTAGGYPGSTPYNTYIKDNASSWIYNKFPEDLQDAIIDTFAVSGYESGKSANYETTDKLYLLAAHEYAEDTDGNASSGLNTYDKGYDSTRQLDYYKFYGTSTSDTSKARRSSGMWTRSAYSGNKHFYAIQNNANITNYTQSSNFIIIPAFRIGSND